jgi:hypothetical protein
MDRENDLGELLFEHKGGGVMWLVPLGLVALAPAGIAIAELSSDAPNVGRAAVSLGIVGVLLLLPLFLRGQVVRFHARGWTERQPMREMRTVRYDEIEHMKWRQVKPRVGVFIGGELVGPRVKLTFGRHVDTGGRVQHTLEDVRDRIASCVSARTLRQVEAGQPFAWGTSRGARVQLRHDGIVYRPIRFLGPGDDQLVPWTTPLSYAFADGFFAVATVADKKSLFTIRCDDPDFYPGFAAFQILRGRGTAG